MMTRRAFSALVCLPSLSLAEEEDRARALWNEQILEARRGRGKPAPGKVEQSYIGLTVWRLRTPQPQDPAGVRLIVHERPMTPERVAAATALDEGDHIRFSVEAARRGYLYLINRERYVNDEAGKYHLIFPSANVRKGDNRVAPGRVFEVPDLQDEPPYLTIRRTRRDQVAEELLILVTTAPLTDIPKGDTPIPLDTALVESWRKRWGGKLQVLDGNEKRHVAYTRAEHAAGAGSTTLTAQDPVPHTVFRVDATEASSVLVNIQLQLRK